MLFSEDNNTDSTDCEKQIADATNKNRPETTSSSSTAIRAKRHLDFVKYHGLGNDFIILNNTHSKDLVLTSSECVALCNRHFGIGGDGVIFVLSGDDVSYDYCMRIKNSDGSEPEMCGNGIRCFAKYVHDYEKEKGMEKDVYRINTVAGVITARFTSDDLIKVDMGAPVLGPNYMIPTTLLPTKDNHVVEATVTALSHDFQVTVVSLGNPHAVRMYKFLNLSFIVFMFCRLSLLTVWRK
jgi:diaminopimelate epimerase